MGLNEERQLIDDPAPAPLGTPMPISSVDRSFPAEW
jgi:hypothetical protein